MAKIKMGAFVTDISGKVGGSVFAKNKAGAYVRRKSTTMNPQTVAQMLVRSLFALLSQAWRSLSESNRTSWNNATSMFQRTNVFGDATSLTGKALFQSLNQNRHFVGLASLDTAPIPADVPAFGATSVVIDTSSNTLTFTNGTSMALGNFLVIEATPSLSAGVSNMKKEFRFIAFGNQTVTPAAAYSAYASKFGVPAETSNVGIRYYTINTNGQASPKVVIPCSVTA
jgi:hypothetical protein